MVTAVDIVSTLRALGFYDFLLPWVFTFAIVYGLLMTVKIFGTDVNQKISAALALVAAFFVTAYAGAALTAFFISIFGGATIVLTGILVIILLGAMIWGPGIKEKEGLKRSGMLVALVIIGVILFIVSTGAAAGIGYWGLLSPDILALIIVLIIIVAAIYMIVSEGERESAPAGEKK